MPDRPALPLRPDRAALLRWLRSDAVVRSDGRVWSWHNPAHPGYAYPEAGGLWLSLMARESQLEPAVEPEELDRVAGWLAECERQGTVGRDGRGYLFDRGMVLAGRLAWAERHARDDDASLHDAMAALLEELEAGRATTPTSPDDRWSTCFGPHLLKLALPLAAWAEQDRRPDPRPALRSLLQRLRPSLDDGRVLGPTPAAPTYLHAHCYAAEGLWRLSTALPAPLAGEAAALAQQAAAWLARVQRPDGGLPPWHDGTRGWGPAPADVAAQAVRLWSGLDRQRHREAIARALAFLARLHRPGGGLRYHEHSDDQNTWATLFAVQALRFAHGPADVRHLV
ncbi:MAG: hypothetical protein KDK70_01900 [Myxococcales bacterium]|nr:hypothetical protein [Myxococcales bacterium]